jgi:hypothetical protein
LLLVQLLDFMTENISNSVVLNLFRNTTGARQSAGRRRAGRLHRQLLARQRLVIWTKAYFVVRVKLLQVTTRVSGRTWL